MDSIACKVVKCQGAEKLIRFCLVLATEMRRTSDCASHAARGTALRMLGL